MSLFLDRQHGGRELARKLSNLDIPEDAIVLGLARGGVPIAHEVAHILDLELDVFVVRKLGVPAQPELALGAIASGDVKVLNDSIVNVLGLTEEQIDRVADRERQELHRREMRYRGDREQPELSGRTVIIADDGLATGASMAVAIEAIKALNPAQIIAAVPVAPKRTCEEIREKVDQLVCLATPDPFFGVGAWYDDFGETTDEDVRRLLQNGYDLSDQELVDGKQGPATILPIDDYGQLVQVNTGTVTLEGNLHIPPGAQGIVLFAHGSGSSRFSPRNRYVAGVLQGFQMGTLLIDLLTSDEEAIDQRTRHLRFDIDLLADRLVGAVDWLTMNPNTQTFKIGLFGASTGAAAAMVAAAKRPDPVRAVVSRGGRPDLAGPALKDVRAPTLCLVGSLDLSVITLNEQAIEEIGAHQKQMGLIPGASHLFSEPGTLDQVANQAGKWFRRFLGDEARPAAR